METDLGEVVAEASWIRVALVELSIDGRVVRQNRGQWTLRPKPVERLVMQSSREALELADQSDEELAIELLGPPAASPADTGCALVNCLKLVEPGAVASTPVFQCLRRHLADPRARLRSILAGIS